MQPPNNISDIIWIKPKNNNHLHHHHHHAVCAVPELSAAFFPRKKTAKDRIQRPKTIPAAELDTDDEDAPEQEFTNDDGIVRATQRESLERIR